MAQRRVASVQRELLDKSKEAALNAVQTFNNPLTTFKTETFIVLMVIAWTYMLHAHYRAKRVEYRYFERKKKNRIFDRTKSGDFKYWELKRCLTAPECPLDNATKANLEFLIGLRNKIEHHGAAGVDDQLGGRYLACCLNYEAWITTLFGAKHSLRSSLALALQFGDLTANPEPEEAARPLPSNVSRYISEFDDSVSEEEYQSPRFSYRLLFVRQLANRRGQADKVIEFIQADSELEAAINKQYVVRKEVERPKHLPGKIVKLMKQEGYLGFNMRHHTDLWQDREAKKPGMGYGVAVGNQWYWYDPWVDEVRKHCAANTSLYSVDRSGP